MTLHFCPECGARIELDPPGSCLRCRVSQWRNSKPCAGALVEHEGRILLVERCIEPFFGWWDIPGGFADAAEHPADTAVREVREETGLTVRATDFLGMWMDTYPATTPPSDTLNCYWVCVPADGVDPDADLRIDPSESSGHGWFAPDEVPWDRLAFPSHAPDVVRAWVAMRSA